MAERLGTGLQNQLQRFESAWNLNEKALTYSHQGFFYLIQS